MAKPKSEDKRNALLSAAVQVFAERGLGAPTAAIMSAAGIAEGSLFTYFKTGVRHRLERVWNLKQIQVWGGLTEESKHAGSAPFTEIQRMAEDAVTQRIYNDVPRAFIGATLVVLAAEMAMDFMMREPESAEMYRTAGFEMLWAAVTRH
jgi:hypothetical protein